MFVYLLSVIFLRFNRCHNITSHSIMQFLIIKSIRTRLYKWSSTRTFQSRPEGQRCIFFTLEYVNNENGFIIIFFLSQKLSTVNS